MWLYVKTVYGVRHLINVDHIVNIKYDKGLHQTAIQTSNEIICVPGDQISNIKEYIVQRAENANRHAVCKLGDFND